MTPESLLKNLPENPVYTTFSHKRVGKNTHYRGEGLRDFFLYCDLGIAAATNGKVLAQLVKANKAPIEGTGWHIHVADFHIVYMIKGWAKFMYGDVDTLVMAGDCIHQRPGIVHYLYDYSPDMEFLEVISPADYATHDAEAPAAVVPPPQAWTDD